MAQTEFFDVTHRGTFFINIKPCEDIAKLSDSFMTREELELMHAGQPNTSWEWNSRVYLAAEIKETCKEWAALIPEGAFGTIRTTSRIKTMIREVNPDRIRRYIHSPYTTRGERIINTEIRNERHTIQAEKEHQAALAKQKALEAAPYVRPEWIIHKDMTAIKHAFIYAFEKEYNLSYSQGHRYSSRKNQSLLLFKFMKRLCNWETIAKEHRRISKKKEYLQDLKYMKMLWDDPTLEP